MSNFRHKSKSLALRRKIRAIFRFSWKYGRVIILCGILVTSATLYHFGWFARSWDKIVLTTHKWLGKEGFVLRAIEIAGNQNVDAASIKQVIKDNYPAEFYSIYQLDLNEIHKNINDIKWVKSTKIQRQSPDRLIITITERTPFAIWQQGELLNLIDKEGYVILTESLTNDNSSIGKYSNLPLLVGDEANLNITELFEFITITPNMFRAIESMSFVGKRRWDIVFKNNVLVKLPENKPAEAWNRLTKLHKNEGILDREISAIDMRIEDRLTVELRDE